MQAWSGTMLDEWLEDIEDLSVLFDLTPMVWL